MARSAEMGWCSGLLLSEVVAGMDAAGMTSMRCEDDEVWSAAVRREGRLLLLTTTGDWPSSCTTSPTSTAAVCSELSSSFSSCTGFLETVSRPAAMARAACWSVSQSVAVAAEVQHTTE